MAMAGLSFLYPWVLAGLAALPLLWLLLRVTPPAPRLIRFPPARFLADILPEESTPRHTPWWILLMRILAAALIILALAQPVLNRAQDLPGTGPIHVLIDNGWASSQTWPAQISTAADIIARAGRQDRNLYIHALASEIGLQAAPDALTATQARAILDGLRPHPWPIDCTGLRIEPEGQVFFLSSGIEGSDCAPLLRTQKNAIFMTPGRDRLPLLLRPDTALPTGGVSHTVLIDTPPGSMPGIPVTVTVNAANGRILDSQDVTTGATKTSVSFSLPAPLRSQAASIRIAGRRSAGAVLILDSSHQRKTVGIAAPPGSEDSAPLTEAAHYIRQALEPTADIIAGSVADLLNKKPPVIILPDIGALPPADLHSLDAWVKDGGLLLRFAGPAMTKADNFLTPVPLRSGSRVLEGSMTWDKAAGLAPFPDHSPFAGLSLSDAITVKRQILADPVEGIENMTWAALSDGTPLITARSEGRGLLVLFHTTATPEWSSLALSGLFVKMLERTIGLAGQPAETIQSAGLFQPVSVLDGYGAAVNPPPDLKPVPVDELAKATPSAQTPPGLYGRAGETVALNMGERLPSLRAPESGGASVINYGADAAERHFMPLLLTVAGIIWAADWLVMMALGGGLFLNRYGRIAGLVFLFFMGLPSLAAQADDAALAGSFHLAYVRTGLSSIDMMTAQGLESVAQTLTRRTSIEPGGVVAVDPARDELSFFPLIYWPVSTQSAPPDDEMLRHVQSYLDHGGTILFDTGGRTGADESLRTITSGLNIPPLIQISDNHVLKKSFYLLKDFPSGFGGSFWVEQKSLNGRDGVSSVMIADQDWGQLWASQTGGRSPELAQRFGVNLVMYALTGNYKADQVHVPYILERLGQ